MKKRPIFTTRIIFIFLCSCFLLYSFYIYATPLFKTNYKTVSEHKLVTNGQLLMQHNNCHTCHQIYGLGGYLGPDLTNVYSRRKQNDDYFKAIIRSGIRQMPPYDFSDDEIAEIIAFLKEIDQTGTADIKNFQTQFTGTFTQQNK